MCWTHAATRRRLARMAGTPASSRVKPAQAAITDTSAGTLTLLTDVITATNELRVKVNAILAALRAAGIIAP